MKEQQAQQTGDYREELITALRNDEDYRYGDSMVATSVFSILGQVGFWFSLLYCLELNSGGAWLLIAPFILIVTLVIGTRESNHLAAYRTSLSRKLIQSGLIARLALGWDYVGMIHDYVPFPWHYFLGFRQKDLPGAIEQLTKNIDWYLREPQIYVNPRWIIGTLGTLGFSGMFLVDGPRLFVALMVFSLAFVPGLYVYHHFRVRSHYATCLLLEEFQRRFQDDVKQQASVE